MGSTQIHKLCINYTYVTYASNTLWQGEACLGRWSLGSGGGASAVALDGGGGALAVVPWLAVDEPPRWGRGEQWRSRRGILCNLVSAFYVTTIANVENASK